MEAADQSNAYLPNNESTGTVPVAPEILPPAPPSPSGSLPSIAASDLPAIIHRSGANAVFAAQEFFFGTVRNEHTRRAYLHDTSEDFVQFH